MAKGAGRTGARALAATCVLAVSACAPALLPVRPVDGSAFTAVFAAATGAVAKVSGTSCSGADLVGSAFVAGDRLLLTAAHVVADARTVEVSFSGEASRAEVVAVDADDDTALLRVTSAVPPPLRLASRPAATGDPVGVIGVPLAEQVTATVTARISVPDDQVELERHQLRDLLVVDAEVQAGSSGGPILDLSGEVQGMVSARIGGRGGKDSSDVVTLGIPAVRLADHLSAWADTPAPTPCS